MVARILGVDPGYGTVGYGVIEVTGNRFQHVAHGAICTTKKTDLSYRLEEIYDSMMELIKEYRPGESAIEKLFFFRNVTTAMAVSEARGVIQLSLAKSGIFIAEYTPFQVKQAVTGSGKAEKGQIQRVLKMLLKLGSTPKPDDAADALAVAICHANSLRTGRIVGGKNCF